MMNNDQSNTVAGMISATDLDIPPFLRRAQQEATMQKENNDSAPAAETPIETPPLTDPRPAKEGMPESVEEQGPTLAQLIDVIEKIGIRIDEMTEKRRLLKKQAETMLKKL